MPDISRARQIPGWMTDEELAWLAAQAERASAIAEIGSWRGRSTRALADSTTGTVFAVDSWDDTAFGFPGPWSAGESPEKYKKKNWLWDEFAANVGEYIGTRIIPLRMFSSEAFEVCSRRGIQFDMVFIDGSHDYAHVRGDILMFRQLLKPGGVLSGHDYGEPTCPEVAPAVHSVFQQVQLIGRIWCAIQ